MNKIMEYKDIIFENIKHIDEDGNEYWLARELQKVLEYTEWRNFSKTISKAIEACENSGNDIGDHFVEVNKIVQHTGDITVMVFIICHLQQNVPFILKPPPPVI